MIKTIVPVYTELTFSPDKTDPFFDYLSKRKSLYTIRPVLNESNDGGNASFEITVYCMLYSGKINNMYVDIMTDGWEPTGAATTNPIPVQNCRIKYEGPKNSTSYWQITFTCSLPVSTPMINVDIIDPDLLLGTRGGVSIGAASVGKLTSVIISDSQ